METHLIIDPPLTGKENMARDLGLLAARKPVLRFYQWQPSCVSLGYFQKQTEDLDLAYLKEEKIDLVRRPTGGRAVFHQTELTYALIWPCFAPSVLERYLKIALVFKQALRKLGLKVEMAGSNRRPASRRLCFSSSSAYEITIGGKKLLGSAQLCQGDYFLQHGSLLLAVDYEKNARIFRLKGAVASALRQVLTGLWEWQEIPIADLIDSICQSFEKEFKSHLQRDSFLK